MDFMQVILDDLLENGFASRKVICRRTGIKWSTAYDNLVELEHQGKVERYPMKYGRGRPTTIWELLPGYKTKMGR